MTNIEDYPIQLRAGEIDLEEFVTDVLTELRHICEQGKLDFDTLDRRAYDHYRVESRPARRKEKRT